MQRHKVRTPAQNREWSRCFSYCASGSGGVRPAGFVVGLTGGEAFARTLREDTVHLRPGDALVLYTDGFSEAMDTHRALFTDARLARLFANADDPSAAALVGHAVADVRAVASAGANPDDLTMLVARLLSGTA